MGLSSWRGLPFKGPTSLSGAMVSHHIMDCTMQGLKPDKPESSCTRVDSRPVARVVCLYLSHVDFIRIRVTSFMGITAFCDAVCLGALNTIAM